MFFFALGYLVALEDFTALALELVIVGLTPGTNPIAALYAIPTLVF
jgi:hypothetical protein